MPTTIIVPSRFPDIFESCRASAAQFAPTQEKILVRDGHDIIDPSGWTTIQAPDGPFIYSRNVNLGINQTKDSVLLMNDDCQFVSTGTVEALEKILDTHADIGILSPRIDGGVGNAAQENVHQPVMYTEQRLAFVCVLIRRKLFEEVGLLDERFVGYGWEDDDYCRRVRDAGYKLACTANAVVKHGHGKDRWSASFNRRKDFSDNGIIYKKKWDYVPAPAPAREGPGITNRPYVYSNGVMTNWWDRHR